MNKIKKQNSNTIELKKRILRVRERQFELNSQNQESQNNTV